MILATDSADARFFHSKTAYVPTLSFRGMKDMDRDGTIKAMVGLDFWTPNSVQMHVYIRSPQDLSRKFIREVFTHVFVNCNRQLVIGVTPSDNAAALELNRRVGFTQTYTMKDAWSEGVDMIVQELRAENCRWIRRH
jgi:hypothetical protein